MARSRSSSTRWRFLNPAYYLKRPKRLAFIFMLFVCATLLFWDRQTLVHEHEEEVSKLNGEVIRLKDLLEEIKTGQKDARKETFRTQGHSSGRHSDVSDDPIDSERREKVKDAMIHAWTSYERYAWGHDELQPQTKNGVNSFGGLGATLIDALDTLYIMGLDEQFQKAREWVVKSLDFNKNYDASVFETTIRLLYKSLLTIASATLAIVNSETKRSPRATGATDFTIASTILVIVAIATLLALFQS